MNVQLKPGFEAFWKNFDPNHRLDEDAKTFIHQLYDLVRRINFEANEIYNPRPRANRENDR